MRKKSEGSAAERKGVWRSLWEKMSQQDKAEPKKAHFIMGSCTGVSLGKKYTLLPALHC